MTYSLMIVDDEPSNFYVLEALLFKENYQLSMVESGEEALRAVKKTPPDLILLDVMMPGMNGIEVCQQLKTQEHSRLIPILMVTALDAKADMAACLEAGADDFLSKPVNGIELKARVRSLLRLKQQQDEIQQALSTQCAISQLREDMASMIVHDFRNPLHAILVGCELLKNTELQPPQLRQLNKIDQAQKQLLNLTNDLLLMSKVDAGRLIVYPEPTELNELVQASFEDWETLAQRKQLTFVLDAPPTGCMITADPKLLRRMIDNLLSNAIKFSCERTQVTVQLEPSPHDSSYMNIHVIDQGIGVDEAVRQQIFQKYNIGTAIEGVSQLGLGLAFCRMVVDAHGGRLLVRDNLPQGAIFTVSLPQQPLSTRDQPHDRDRLLDVSLG